FERAGTRRGDGIVPHGQALTYRGVDRPLGGRDMHAAMMPERGVVQVSGPEARNFLHGLVSNDVLALGPDRAGYAALLSPQGKVLFDFPIVAHDEAFLLDCERPRAG